MDTNKINQTLKEIAQYRMMKAQAEAELKRLEGEIKAHMEDLNLEELIGDEHKVIYREVEQMRFSPDAFKKDHADMYEAYKRPSVSRPFKFS